MGRPDLWDEGRKSTYYGLFLSPFLRFLQLYLMRLGFLDGLVGFQLCILMAFNTFAKQARLWEEGARPGAVAPHPLVTLRTMPRPVRSAAASRGIENASARGARRFEVRPDFINKAA